MSAIDIKIAPFCHSRSSITNVKDKLLVIGNPVSFVFMDEEKEKTLDPRLKMSRMT